ncbi:MAG: ATP-binding protein [Deltaproteobacteria bacterium]|nr:ATP-binding protein [Deltaproteobacteria bacterium]
MERAQIIAVLQDTMGGRLLPTTIDPALALTDSDIEALAELVKELPVKAGGMIIREGDEGDSLFIVASGSVTIIRMSPEGEELPVTELEAGTLFGELALLEGGRRSASVRASNDTILLRLDRAPLRELLVQQSPLAYKLLFALTLHVTARVRQKDVQELEARARALEGLVQERTEELQRLLERESMMNLITSAIRGHLDLDRVLQTTVEQVGRAVGVSRCRLALFSPGTDDHSVEHEYTAPGVASTVGLKSPGFKAIEPALKFMIETRRPYVIGDVGADPLTKNLGNDYPEFVQALKGTRSVLIVPLFYADEFIGELTLFTSEPHRWKQEEQDFVQAIGDQVSVAIKQSKLYWDLAEQKDQLSEAIEELQRKEQQLIQSEKMASLGQLVAGVAHELNNPISIVYGFLGQVSRRLSLLREVLERGQTVDADVFEELDDMLSRSKEGALRTKNIVSDLRTFSRLDEAEFKDVDLHAGLESTLHLLEHRLGDRLTVHRNYGDLPPVACYAGQMNQVFMNLLSNAIDAIEHKGGPGDIYVRTWAIGDEEGQQRVAVSVRDTGTGIPPDKVSRVFDPFFTTKPIGQGTGLGLSVSHGIVSKHGGIIRVESRMGEGSTFTVELPIGPRAA